MEKILISACLLGKPVRYDGKIKPFADSRLAGWKRQDRLMAFCPEVAGGLPIPRTPAEIQGAGGGEAVLAGTARVIDKTGRDVTEQFIKGAFLALEACRLHEIRTAILTDLSPSCGSTRIYNGRFVRETITGTGVTTALLRQHGITVFSQYQIPDPTKTDHRVL
jgi:uncharacterized protein YbbK (DUF523 family)